MPRFFFHLHNDIDTHDEEGRDLPDIDAARRSAEHDARNMAAESVRAGHLVLDHFVEVTGEEGRRSFALPSARSWRSDGDGENARHV